MNSRLRRILPALDEHAFSSVDVITARTHVTRNKSWGSFGSRAAFLQLFLNPGVNQQKLLAYQDFFQFLVKCCLKYLPRAEADRFAYSKLGRITLQTVLASNIARYVPTQEEKNRLRLKIYQNR